MEKVGCITFNNVREFDGVTRSLIKDFILKEDVKDALEHDDFDTVFKKWRDYHSNYLPRSLIKVFLEAGIDFLSYMHKIPNYFFENCEFIECVEIPANITTIGWWDVFKYTNLKKFIIKKRNRSNALNMARSTFYSINNSWKQGNKTEYEFEGTKEEFYDIINYGNPNNDKNYITFICSNGEIKV